MNSTLDVTDATTLSSTLDVTGATTMDSTLTVNGMLHNEINSSSLSTVVGNKFTVIDRMHSNSGGNWTSGTTKYIPLCEGAHSTGTRITGTIRLSGGEQYFTVDLTITHRYDNKLGYIHTYGEIRGLKEYSTDGPDIVVYGNTAGPSNTLADNWYQVFLVTNKNFTHYNLDIEGIGNGLSKLWPGTTSTGDNESFVSTLGSGNMDSTRIMFTTQNPNNGINGDEDYSTVKIIDQEGNINGNLTVLSDTLKYEYYENLNNFDTGFSVKLTQDSSSNSIGSISSMKSYQDDFTIVTYFQIHDTTSLSKTTNYIILDLGGETTGTCIILQYVSNSWKLNFYFNQTTSSVSYDINDTLSLPHFIQIRNVYNSSNNTSTRQIYYYKTLIDETGNYTTNYFGTNTSGFGCVQGESRVEGVITLSSIVLSSGSYFALIDEYLNINPFALDISGSAAIDVLDVSNATTLRSTLNVSGATTLNSTLDVGVSATNKPEHSTLFVNGSVDSYSGRSWGKPLLSLQWGDSTDTNIGQWGFGQGGMTENTGDSSETSTLAIGTTSEGGNWGFSPKIFITTGGNLGIGTNAPSEKLHVNGAANVSGTFSAPGIMRLLHNSINTAQDIISSTTVNNAGLYTIASGSVTLSGSSSKIYVNFDANYTISGSKGDTWFIHLYIGTTLVFTKTHVFHNASGGGTRSSILAPLIYMSTSTYSGSQSISIFVQRGTTDDTMYMQQKNLMIYEVYT